MTQKEVQDNKKASESNYQDPYKTGPSSYAFSFSSHYPDQKANQKAATRTATEDIRPKKVVKKD